MGEPRGIRAEFSFPVLQSGRSKQPTCCEPVFHLLVKTVDLERCLEVQSTMLHEAQGLPAPFSASGASGRRQDACSVLEDGTEQEHLCHEPSKSALALVAQLRQGERAGAVGSLNQKKSLLRKGPGGQKKGR